MSRPVHVPSQLDRRRFRLRMAATCGLLAFFSAATLGTAEERDQPPPVNMLHAEAADMRQLKDAIVRDGGRAMDSPPKARIRPSIGG